MQYQQFDSDKEPTWRLSRKSHYSRSIFNYTIILLLIDLVLLCFAFYPAIIPKHGDSEQKGVR